MKRIYITVILLLISTHVSAISIQWLPLGITTIEGNPSTLLGSPVLEYRNAGDGGIDWITSGIGPRGGLGVEELWLFDDSAAGIPGTSEATTTFSTASNSVGFMMNGDHNDGFAQFFVDGIDLGVYDLFNTGRRSLVVTGLNLAAHTLKIVQLGLHNPLATKGDVAIFGGAAFNTQTVSEPSVLSFFFFPLLYLFVHHKPSFCARPRLQRPYGF